MRPSDDWWIFLERAGEGRLDARIELERAQTVAATRAARILATFLSLLRPAPLGRSSLPTELPPGTRDDLRARVSEIRRAS